MEKRLLSVLLTLCMVLSLLPGTAWASVEDGTVGLKPTNEIRWIDRVELPDFALKLYETLEEAIDGDGYNDYLIDDEYYDLEGTNIRTDVPGGFMRGTVSYSNGSTNRYTAIVVTTTETATIDQDTRDYIANCIYTVLSAFKFDHQEVFWINGQDIVGFDRNDGKTYYGLALCSRRSDSEGRITSYYEIRRDEFRADGQWDIHKAMARRDADVEKILSTIPAGADRFTQIYYLNDWLSEHNKFNSLISSGKANPWYAYECITALEGLEGEKGPVCSGYSAAFKVLCDALGIPCVTVRGLGGSGGAHRWNYAQMEDGRWYAVDVNYNSDSGDASRTLHLLVGGKTLISSKEFRERHVEQNGAYYDGVEHFLNGPLLSDEACPRSVHLAYMGMPEKLTFGDPVEMTPALIFDSGAEYIYSSTTLPAGLTMDAATGKITGTLTDTSEAVSVTITLTNPDNPKDCAECTLTFPAVSSPPEWRFLFAVFKNVNADCADGNGTTTHTTYTMTQDEIDIIHNNARAFEKYLNQFSLIRARVDIVEINTPVTELTESATGSYIAAAQAAPFLEKKGIDLDQYDYVTCAVSLNVATRYLGKTASNFENGTGYSCINLKNREFAQKYYFTTAYQEATYVHEFLHFMEKMTKKWGTEFQLHDIILNHYVRADDVYLNAYTDIILNRFTQSTELGTGVTPAAWQYPPHALRTMRDLTIPEGVTAIGDYAFQNLAGLENVVIPGSVTSIGKQAFFGCSSLGSVSISSGVTSIGNHAFRECGSLQSVSIPDSVADIGIAAFAYCGALQSARLPSNITSLAASVFYDCKGLSSISIPGSVTSIGNQAFYNCTSLTDVYYAGSESQWERIKIDNAGNDSLLNATIHNNSPIIFVAVNGNAVAWTDAAPFIDPNNRTMVPLRAVGDALGLTVDWNNSTREAIFTNGTKTIYFPIDKTAARTGEGQNIQMDTAAVIVNGRTFAPVRYLAEFFGFHVDWDSSTGTVLIT